MSVTIWNRLLVDRIHMTVGIKSKDLYAFTFMELKKDGIAELQADIVPNGKMTVYSGKYVTRLNYYPDKSKDKIADIEIGSTKSKHKYFRLGLYPSKFGLGEFEHLKEIMSILLPEEFNYNRLYDIAKVSYLELAADTRSHPAHSYIPFRGRCNKSKIITDDNGSKGTTKLGSELSQLRFSIYDKQKQLTAKKQVAPYKIHTRFEAQLCHTGLSPCELLAELPNPFVKLEIANSVAARLASQDMAWQDFLDLCFEIGSAQALATLHPKQRKEFMAMLRANKVWWWNPHLVWANLPNALCAIAP